MPMIGLAKAPCDEGVIRAAAATSDCAERSKPWVLAATILGSSLAFIDGSVVNVALPAIQSSLGASIQEVQWIVNAYLFVLSALILIGGAAGDHFGRRRIFIWGIAAFTTASVICGIAPSAIVLIVARAAQGLGAAFLVPSSLAIISAAFPGAERGTAIGTWAGFSALTTALGPVLGGWLVDTASWRAIFFINVPFALITLGVTFWHVPESRDAKSGAAVDVKGALLAAAGLGALTYGLTETSDLGWAHPAVLVSVLAGALLLGAFLHYEARARAPMMPLRLFRSRSFSGANAITLLLYAALSGALFFLPYNLIRYQGYSVAQAGAAFLPFTLVMGGLSRWSGELVERFGARKPLIVGPIIVAAGFALLAVPGVGGSYWVSFFPALVVLGLGMAASVAPLTTTVMSAVEDRYAGAASGINNAFARVASLIAVALFGAIALTVFDIDLSSRLGDLLPPVELKRLFAAGMPKLGDATVPVDIGTDTARALAQAQQASFVLSFRVVMLTAAGLALAAAQCAWLTIDRHPGAK